MPRASAVCQHTFPSVPQQEIGYVVGALADEQIGKLANWQQRPPSSGCADAVLHGAPFRRRSSAPIAAEELLHKRPTGADALGTRLHLANARRAGIRFLPPWIYGPLLRNRDDNGPY